MAKYRKKPIIIEAVGPIAEEEYIETLEGTMKADVGDYIITGVSGERYPCKPDIFNQTYEPVEEKDAGIMGKLKEQIDRRLVENEREKEKEHG